MNMSDFTVIATADHPLFKKLQNIGARFFDYKDPKTMDEVAAIESSYWLDFTLLDQYKKETLLQNLSGHIASDLTFNDGAELHEHLPHLVASFAAGSRGPTHGVEFFASDMNMAAMFIEIFEGRLKQKVVFTAGPGIGFYYARIMSLIANEALFAQEESLASDEDLDNAMKFGVNYPIGPLAWAKSCGYEKIAWLLQALYHKSKDNRYLLSETLQKSLKE